MGFWWYDINFAVGESLKKFETRGCDIGKNQKPHHRESDGRVGHLDRLAIPVWLRQTPGKVQIHPSVHISIRLLHGDGQKAAGMGNQSWASKLRMCITYIFFSLSISKLSWKLRLRIWVGRLNTLKQQTEVTWRTKWTSQRRGGTFDWEIKIMTLLNIE